MLKNYVSAFLTCLFFQGAAFAQTPCDSSTGMAGVYPCNDYDLMSNVPISVLATTVGTPEGSDIWGWTDSQTGKEYAIVGTTNSTAFVDVSDPVNPVFLGRIEKATNETGLSYWRDVKVYNNYAFIVADGAANLTHGMQIFDLTILRNGVDPNLTFDGAQVLKYTGDGGSGDLVIGSCHNIVINESEGVAYLVGCELANGGGPIFIDISTPTSPTTLGDYTAAGYTHDAQVVTYNGPDTDHTGKQIYIGSNGNTGKVVILDVTDKANVTLINDFTYPQTVNAHQGWFTEDQRYFILGDEDDEKSFGNKTRTLVFDMIDLDADFSNPALLNTYFGPTLARDHNGYVNGDKFYLANYRAGMRVLDVPTLLSLDNSASEIGFFDTYPSSNSEVFNGAWSIYPYFASGNIIISDIERGLFVVRQSNTLSTPEYRLTDSFSLSPNPTTSVSIIKSNSNTTINSIQIYSILGQKVYANNNINTREFVLPLDEYRSGIYLVKINGTTTKKLIKK